jgi:opacity protein-like surface antigen
MFLRKLVTIASLAILTIVATPTKASADWLLTPFVGWNWGGSANFINYDDFDDEFEQRANFGVSLGWMGAGIIGFEFDLGFTPNFFANTRGPGDFEFGDSSVTTVMGNLLLGVPIGGQHGVGFRPYAVGGVGLIMSSITGPEDIFDVDTDHWGFNVGAGAIFFFTDSFGLRGDVRYFRSLQDEDPDDILDLGLADFNFWRGSIGATIRF